jgi:transposase, IS5 family
LLLRESTVVDTTLIAAPSSIMVNKDGQHDSEMHQPKKGNRWHRRMKAYICVDADSTLVHALLGTTANVDVTQASKLDLGDESDVFADVHYQGEAKREEA